jgi:hypothetical protein
VTYSALCRRLEQLSFYLPHLAVLRHLGIQLLEPSRSVAWLTLPSPAQVIHPLIFQVDHGHA